MAAQPEEDGFTVIRVDRTGVVYMQQFNTSAAALAAMPTLAVGAAQVVCVPSIAFLNQVPKSET